MWLKMLLIALVGGTAISGSVTAAEGASLETRAERATRAYLASVHARDAAKACSFLVAKARHHICPDDVDSLRWNGPRLGRRWSVRAVVDGALVRVEVRDRGRKAAPKTRDRLWVQSDGPARILKTGRLLPLALGRDADDPQLTSRPLRDTQLRPALSGKAAPCVAGDVRVADPIDDVQDPLGGLPPSGPARSSIDVRAVHASIDDGSVRCLVIDFGAPPRTASGLLIGGVYRSSDAGAGVLDLGTELGRSYIFFDAARPVVSPRVPDLAVATADTRVAITLPTGAVPVAKMSYITIASYADHVQEPLLTSDLHAEDDATLRLPRSG